jgi:5-methylcytosine-specific restriction endonuclease McrA
MLERSSLQKIEHPRRMYMQRWYAGNRDRVLEQKVRYGLKKRYGLTLEMYAALSESQDHRCAICRVPGLETKSKKLHVDHSHQTGKVRGLLCAKCNVALGVLENTALVEKGQVYLEKFK